MPLTRAQIQKDYRDSQKAKGLKKIEIYVANNPEAERQLKDYVKKLNNKFNIMKFG